MDFFKTIAVAFSMFSKIRMPYFEWTERNTKYMMLAFPLVGIVVGLINVAVFLFLRYFAFSGLFTSATLVMIPIIITGGIHLDGYVDTLDALSSHQERLKKLEILSDPHIGAFGVLGLICYISFFIIVVGEIEKTEDVLVFMMTIPFISRCVSALGVVSMSSAKGTGSVKTFKDSADGKVVKNVIHFANILTFSLLFVVNKWLAITVTIINIIVFLRWSFMIKKEFGGITGDLSGYLTQKLEFYMFLGILMVQKIGDVI